MVPRPQFYQTLLELPTLCGIKLEPLDISEVEDLLASRLSVNAAEVPKELLSMINMKSQGNPLFVEEMLRTLREVGAIRVVNGKCICDALPENIFSDSIQGVITGRIDRLPETQQVNKLLEILPRRLVQDGYRILQYAS
jgi:predicted ATPase